LVDPSRRIVRRVIGEIGAAASPTTSAALHVDEVLHANPEPPSVGGFASLAGSSNLIAFVSSVIVTQPAAFAPGWKA
jgi:hypothetical protein